MPEPRVAGECRAGAARLLVQQAVAFAAKAGGAGNGHPWVLLVERGSERRRRRSRKGSWEGDGGAVEALWGGCYQIVNNWMICEIREIRNCCGVKIRVLRSRPVWVMFSVAGFIILIILPNGEITWKSSLQSASASSGATDAPGLFVLRCAMQDTETPRNRHREMETAPPNPRRHPKTPRW